MNKSQPTYSKEFKLQAVHLFESSGKNKTAPFPFISASVALPLLLLLFEKLCSFVTYPYGFIV